MKPRDVRFMGSETSWAKAGAPDIFVNDRSGKVINLGPACVVCGDTGWVSTGPDRRMARCHCFLEARSTRLVAAARIPTRYAECALATFRTEGNASLSKARIAADEFVAQYPVDKTGLMLVGDTGLGKTHLAVAIMKELMSGKGIPTLFCDYRELLKQIQSSYDPSVQTTELEILRPIFETEVLALDDLGATRASGWVWDTVSFILNTRYNDKRTTVITTNFPDLKERDRPARNADSQSSQVARYSGEKDTLGDRIGERMRSRLHEMCRIVRMEGEDYRQRFRSGR